MIRIDMTPMAAREPVSIVANTKTIADIILAMDDLPGIANRTRSDYKSALRTVARAHGADPSAIPANPPAITRRLRHFEPAELGLTSRSWSNALSLACKALRATGCYVAPGAYNTPFTSAWATLADAIEDNRLRYGLSRYLHIASEHNWAPEDVGEEHFERFRHYLETRVSCKDPDRQWLRVRQLWNQAARSVPGWPQNFVQTAVKPKGYCFLWSDFPASLKSEVDVYLESRSTADVFADQPVKPMKPSSRASTEFRIRQFGSAAVRAGVSFESLSHIEDLLNPTTIERGFRFFLGRSGGQVTSQIFALANILFSLARLCERLSESQRTAALAKLDKVRRNPDGSWRFKRTGMVKKNKMLLQQFNDPVNVAKIVYAADIFCEGLPVHGPLTVRQAEAARSALMTELLLVFPIREDNLASLRLDRHFQWSQAGRRGLVSIFIEGGDVKNDQDLEVQLPGRTARLLRYYLDYALPVLGDPRTQWLFPGEKGHLHPRAMGEQFKRVVKRTLGLNMHMHFMRHLCAKLYLDRNPGQFEVIQRALGHTNVETTMKFYAEFSSVAALKLVDDNLLGLREELGHLAPINGRRPGRRRR